MTPGTVLGEYDLFLDPRGRVAVRGRAVGLQREDHSGLEFDWSLERIQPADDRPLVQRETESVPDR
jgi:hypothetical protein